jgi:hypothetical protein
MEAFAFTFALALAGAQPGWLGNVLRDCFCEVVPH